VAAVDHGHVDLGIVDEGIYESHACSTGADDQVVSLDSERLAPKGDSLDRVPVLWCRHLSILLAPRRRRR